MSKSESTVCVRALSANWKRSVQRKMNEDLRVFIEDLVASSEANRLPMAYGGGRIFARPLVGISSGDDDIFETYKQVVGPEHLTPAEMWVQSGFPDEEGLAARLRVVSIAFPFTHQIRDAGTASGDGELPPEIYCVARNLADPFMRSVQEEMVRFLWEQGYQALSGTQSQLYRVLTEREPCLLHLVGEARRLCGGAGHVQPARGLDHRGGMQCPTGFGNHGRAIGENSAKE
jgi:hypothetical protein